MSNRLSNSTKVTANEMRRRLRTARRDLSPFEQQRSALCVAKRFATLQWRPKRVGVYWPDDGEVDPRVLMRALVHRGCRLFLPCIPNAGTVLKFARFDFSMSLCPGRFGIPRSSGEVVSAHQLDWVLVPVVAFDQQGHRLGRGGGYYDRTFAGERLGPKPLLVGLAHDLQEVEEITAQPHDVRLDALVTPTRVLTFPSRIASQLTD